MEMFWGKYLSLLLPWHACQWIELPFFGPLKAVELWFRHSERTKLKFSNNFSSNLFMMPSKLVKKQEEIREWVFAAVKFDWVELEELKGFLPLIYCSSPFCELFYFCEKWWSHCWKNHSKFLCKKSSFRLRCDHLSPLPLSTSNKKRLFHSQTIYSDVPLFCRWWISAAMWKADCMKALWCGGNERAWSSHGKFLLINPSIHLINHSRVLPTFWGLAMGFPVVADP